MDYRRLLKIVVDAGYTGRIGIEYEGDAHTEDEGIKLTKALLERCSRQSVSVEELADASAEPRLNEECHGGLKAFFAKEKAPWVPK